MNTQNPLEERLPDFAQKFLYGAISGVVISTLELILKTVLPEAAQTYVKLLTNLLLILILGLLFFRVTYLKTFMRLQKWKAWRVINSLILLFAFFAPWFRSCSGTANEVIFNGYDTFLWSGMGAASVITASSLADFFDALLWILTFIGLLFIVIYAVMNLRKTFATTKKNRWRFISLAMGLVGMFSGFMILKQNVSDLLWGYWLNLGGLLSSVALEGLSPRENQPERPQETKH